MIFTKWLSLIQLFKIIRGTLSKKYFFWFHVLFFTCEVNLVYILHFASSSPFWASWLHFYEMINMVEFVLKSKSNILDECLLILCLVFDRICDVFCYISIFCNFIAFLNNLAWFLRNDCHGWSCLKWLENYFVNILMPFLVSDIWHHLLTLFCHISLIWPLHCLLGQLILIYGILLVNELFTAESFSKNAKL